MNNNNDNVVSWLILLLTPNIGPTTVLKLLETFVSPAKLLAASHQELVSFGLSPQLITQLQNPNWQLIEEILVWAEQDDNALITWQDFLYPRLLKETVGAPLVLFARGNLEALSSTQLAIVGSRNPTPTGLDIAYQFAQHLSAQGFTITSGLALGIDAASHEGALANKGLTVAVMGAGLEQIYPIRHKTLAKQILANEGILISEFPPKVPPKPENFPRRNRIISGLSLGTLVVEAAVQSGSLITARYALEQGREVFAVPGSIHNPLARGCHALLKQGAKLVETAADIMEELRGHVVGSVRVEKDNITKLELPKLDSQDTKLVKCVGFETTAIDTLIERSGLSAEVVSVRLMMLELQGHVMAVPGGYLRKTV